MAVRDRVVFLVVIALTLVVAVVLAAGSPRYVIEDFVRTHDRVLTTVAATLVAVGFLLMIGSFFLRSPR